MQQAGSRETAARGHLAAFALEVAPFMQAVAAAAEQFTARRALVVLAAVLQRLIVRSMAPQGLQTPAAAAPVKA